MMRRSLIAIALLAAMTAMAPAQAPKGSKSAPPPAPASAPEDGDGPAFVALSVPGFQIASHPDLVIEAIEATIGLARITTTYRLRNKGANALRLAASFAMPALTASNDGSEAYRVGANADNPIGLKMTTDGAAITAKVEARATALNMDRTADLRALNIPLIPFGEASDSAIAALPKDDAGRLIALGLLSPQDPEQPDLAPLADWTLTVTHGFDVVLPPQKTVTLTFGHAPIAGSFTVTKDNAVVLDEIKDDTCLAPAALKALKAKVQAKNAPPLPVAELVISNEAPTRWVDVPAMTLAIDKPSADVLVAFCGAEIKTAPTRVTGKAPDTGDSVRILLIGAEIK